ncbi:tyrosine-type recombinase/integrase [Pimelobacter simplex]|uniref:tyrosine-type recombinase/integrase n=1 Tax=Nocardioides simplex TaxID=2045 RepID=UPI0021500B6D|nr:site-specific integrase [Pimelobacter simplex]UUW88345.1 site-specific integrase [Pimelobacter simplex]UUW97849.1 site-specific integrase [Pimelobacter simplex]
MRHTAPTTYDTREDAEAWLTDERRLISAGTWAPPAVRRAERDAAARASTFASFTDYATAWIEERRVKGRPLAAKTRDHYTDLLGRYLTPAFGTLPIDQITPEVVSEWYDAFKPAGSRKGNRAKGKDAGATARAHTYSFGRAVMNTAISAHGPLVGRVNPFAIRGGGSSPGRRREELATAEEVKVMLATIRPDWRALIELGLWTGLRYGEIVGLRRADIDLTRRVVRVRYSIARTKSEGVIQKGTKSDAGERDQRIPANLVPVLLDHLKNHVAKGRTALLFPSATGKHLAPSAFYGKPLKSGGNGWYAAREAAGHPSLHFHDLRATGATLFAQQGATEAEIMAWLGDSTPQAAQRYVRAARSRMDMLTNKMSEVATAGEW